MLPHFGEYPRRGLAHCPLSNRDHTEGPHYKARDGFQALSTRTSDTGRASARLPPRPRGSGPWQPRSPTRNAVGPVNVLPLLYLHAPAFAMGMSSLPARCGPLLVGTRSGPAGKIVGGGPDGGARLWVGAGRCRLGGRRVPSRGLHPVLVGVGRGLMITPGCRAAVDTTKEGR